MKKVYILGRVRGFFSHLIKDKNMEIEFINDKGTYEVNSKLKKFIANLLRKRLIGFWGIFKVLKIKNTEIAADYYLSFNRFVDSDKPYVIYLENPTALCNYSLTCLHSPFVKRRLKRYIEDENLKKIICMSNACENTLQKVLNIPIPEKKIIQIYPYVPRNLLVSEDKIYKRCNDKLSILYIAQGARFRSKGGAEIIHAYIELRKKYEVSLTIITNIKQLDRKILKIIKENDIDLYDFEYTYQQLEHIYMQHTLLVQPSSDDSFGMTVLEGMKAGLPIITSDMYAFKEMVIDGKNGFLLSPAYYFFDKSDMPNPKVWNHRKRTIYSKRINGKLVQDLYNKIELLYKDRSLLFAMSMNSLERAEIVFGRERLITLWNDAIRSY